MGNDGFYYLHSDGQLIFKPASVATSRYDSYFESSFVRKVWEFNSEDRSCPYQIILEALAMGADVVRVKELSEKWGLTLEDSFKMVVNVDPTRTMREGMSIFIEKILEMDIEEYWDKVRQMGKKNGQVDERKDEGEVKGPG